MVPMRHLIEGVASKNDVWLVLVFVTVLLAGASGYGFYRIMGLEREVLSLSQYLASTTAALEGTQGNLADLRYETTGLSENLASTKQEVDNNINAVRSQVGGVQAAVGSISGTVSTLEKLSTIDSELLRKYSKVYFLNENYTPAHIVKIPQEYVYSNTKPEEFLEEAWPHLQQLLAAAKASNVELYVKSSYRSFDEQQTLKSAYSFTYGAGTANAFSADQGYSEHQLGTTVDFITGGFNGNLTEGFDKTQAFLWLRDNAYKYGFEMSYPKGNSYYTYEPWHWRFVGVQLATYLHNTGKNFYDVDQRDIDSYLANLFD